jgi:formate hydrogenlyase transcriptional activator
MAFQRERSIGELKDKLSQEKLYLEEEIRGKMDFEGIVGQSSALRHVLNLSARVPRATGHTGISC